MSTGPDTIRDLPPLAERKTEPAEKAESEARAIPESPEKLIELSDDDIIEYIGDSQAETDKLLTDVEKELPIGLAETVPIRQEVMQALAANGQAMDEVAEGARRRAEAVMAGEDIPDLTAEAELIEEEENPEQAIDELIGRGPDASYEEKLNVLVPALEANPELGARLDEIGLSTGEKLGVLLRVARREPTAFFRAVETSNTPLSPEEQAAITQDLVEKNPALLPMAAKQFGFSHETLSRIISEAPQSDRKGLLHALEIPGPDGSKSYSDFSQDEIAWFMEGETSPEKREVYEQVERVKEASRDLMLALEEAFPERQAAERERARMERELLGRIEAYRDLGADSANKPLVINLEGRDLPAVYKPKSREGFIRTGIKQGEMVGREVLATFIDRSLKLDLAPATVLRDGPEGIGTVQDWKVGTLAYKLGDQAYDQKHAEQLTRLALFDWLTNNSDRHNGNWLVSPDGKHQAIDNGSIFAKRVTVYDGLRSFPSSAMAGQPLPPELRRNVEELAGSPEVMAALKQGFEATLSPEDAKRSWKEFTGKLKEIMDDKDFKIRNTEWIDFPKA